MTLPRPRWTIYSRCRLVNIWTKPLCRSFCKRLQRWRRDGHPIRLTLLRTICWRRRVNTLLKTLTTIRARLRIRPTLRPVNKFCAAINSNIFDIVYCFSLNVFYFCANTCAPYYCCAEYGWQINFLKIWYILLEFFNGDLTIHKYCTVWCQCILCDEESVWVSEMVKLFVGNLADSVDSNQLRSLFLQYVHVQECDVLKNYAFVVSFLSLLHLCQRISLQKLIEAT